MKKDSEVLNDLIKVNNDRIKGYQKAITEVDHKDADLKKLFSEMAAQSKAFTEELQQVKGQAPAPAEETSLSGDIYRAWMDVKTVFTGNDRKSVLVSCERGEDAAQRAYLVAFKNEEISEEVRQRLVNQRASLKKSHDKIKRLRDKQPAGL